MIQQEINLNLIPSSEPVVVHCNQYDEGKARIIAHLYNGSHPYTPGATATVKVQGTKPDNHAFQYWCDISGSTVTVDVNVQMTAVAGRTPTQLIVNETSGVTGSFAFYLDVQASTLPPTIDVSETDIPILTEEAQEAAQRAIMAAASAQDSADDAAAWSSNPPYIGSNDNWFVYDTTTEQFVDTGILARGTNGEDGNKWYTGTAVNGKSATPTAFNTGIAYANTGDLYLNTTEGAVYHCDTPGDDTTATWVYDFTLTSGGGGGTITVIDNLNSTSSTDALSANQGHVLKGLIDGKADNAPTFSQASTRANIASGENVSTLFGKIMKWFTDLKDLAFIAKDGATSTKYLRGDGTWQSFPTIPTVNDATLTIQQNGSNKATFTANSSSNKTANIITDDWVKTGTVSSGSVSFSGVDDTSNYGYEVFVQITASSTNKNPSAQISSISGTGTSSMSITYTTDADNGATCKLRRIK